MEKKRNIKKLNIILSIVAVILISSVVVSAIFYNIAKNKPIFYFSNNYNTYNSLLREKVKEQQNEITLTTNETGNAVDNATNTDNTQTTTESPMLKYIMEVLEKFNASFEYYRVGDITPTEDYNNFEVQITTVNKPDKAIMSNFLVTFNSNEKDQIFIEIAQQMRQNNISIYFQTNEFSYQAQIEFNGEYTLAQKELTNEQIELVKKYTPLAIEKIENVIQNDILKGSTIKYNLNTIFLDQYYGYKAYSTWIILLFAFVIIFPCLLIMCAYFILRFNFIEKWSKNLIDNTATDTILDFSSLTQNTTVALQDTNVQTLNRNIGEVATISTQLPPKKMIIKPIIPELALKIIGTILLFISSFSIFLLFLEIQAGYPHKGMEEFLRFLKRLIPIAIILLFFLKIDISIRRKKLLETSILYFFAGLCLFYAVFIISATLNLDKFNEIFIEIKKLIPGNIFFGLASYSFLPLFLFYTPKGAINNKKKLIFWRLLSLIPIIYLIVSNFVTPFLGLNIVTHFIMDAKSTFQSIFTITYIFVVFGLRKYTIKKYKENANLYIDNDHYVMIKNILTIILITILSLIDFLLYRFVPSSSTIGFGKFYWMFVLIPFILLYKPYTKDRNTVIDGTFGLLYGASLMSTYIALVFYFGASLKTLFFPMIGFYIFLMTFI